MADYISGIMLQRVFFRHFFDTLYQKGVRRIPHAYGASRIDSCFGKALDVLRSLRDKNRELERLEFEIGLDPCTGSSRAFWENLIHIFPHRVDSRHVWLNDDLVGAADWLSQDLIDRMAQAFFEIMRTE